MPRRECCVLRRVVGKGLTEKMAFEQRLAEAIQIYIYKLIKIYLARIICKTHFTQVSDFVNEQVEILVGRRQETAAY